MSLILIVSIAIRIAAMGWSIVLLRRIRDWRMAFLTAMLALMATRQILTLLNERESWAISVTGQATELPGLMVSIMAFVAVLSLNVHPTTLEMLPSSKYNAPPLVADALPEKSVLVMLVVPKLKSAPPPAAAPAVALS